MIQGWLLYYQAEVEAVIVAATVTVISLISIWVISKENE